MSTTSREDVRQQINDTANESYQSAKGSKATAKYGKMSEFMRHAVPEHQVCKMFCGGKNCKYCSVGHWKEEQMTVKGLFSSWVTDNILATARPTKEAVEMYEAIKQFNEFGIKSIINLQTSGEHASCGNALHESGFSYDPQEFMDHDVFFYNFGWPDYNVGSLQTLLDMTKVMDFALSQGKAAVHCHAGLGRTGVLIAAYLIYAHRMDPHDAIHYVRSKRPGAIQTRTQITCLEEYASYLKPLRIVFTDVPRLKEKSGDVQVETTNTVPVVSPGGCSNCKSANKVQPESQAESQTETQKEKVPEPIQNVPQSSGTSKEFTLKQFLYKQQKILHGFEARELKHLPKIVYITCERLLQLAKKGRSLKRHSDNFEIVKKTSPAAFNNKPTEPQEDGEHSGEDERQALMKKSRSLNNLSPRNVDEEIDDEVTEEENNMLHPSVVREATSDAEWVAQCVMEVQEIDQAIKEKAQEHKIQLNSDDRQYSEIGQESNPSVLAMLLFDWLDALKEPVLGSQDLPYMLMNYMNDPLKGLNKLSQGARVTTEYLMGVLVRLSPISDKILQDLLQKLLSVLAHRLIDIASLDVTVSSTQGSTNSLRGTQVMNRTQVIGVIKYFAVLLDQIKDKMDNDHEQERKK